MLIYGTDGDRHVVVASQGGAPADPEVHVQVKADKFTARARTATEAEKPALWKMMVGVYPPYEEYQAKTDRSVPVVILERA